MKKILSFALLLVIVVACGKKENKTLQSYVSSFVGQNKAIALFGRLDTKKVLDKAGYNEIPLYGEIAKSEIEGLKNEINVDAPMYFALEGPFEDDGTPTSTYLFAEVKNVDSLSANLKKRGFDLEQDDDLNIARSGDVAFGFQNNLFVLVSKKGEFDEKAILADVFEKVYEEEAGDRVNKILAGKGDVVYGVSIANLVNSSNTELKDLDEKTQKSLSKLVDNSFLGGSLKLEDGAAIFETKNLFSSDLQKAMFMKEDQSAEILSLLGSGQPRLGVSLNFDMKKLQDFLDKYAPGALSDLSDDVPPLQMAMLTAGDKGLAGLFNGQFGFAMLGDPSADGTFTPNFNVHVGLAEQGQSIAQTFQGFLKQGMAQVDLTPKGLSAYSNANYLPKQGVKIQLPEGCENFGKKGFTLFANLDGLNLENFELEGTQKLLNVVKYVTIEADNNGVRVYLKAKDDKVNIAKQAVSYLLKEFEGNVAQMGF